MNKDLCALFHRKLHPVEQKILSGESPPPSATDLAVLAAASPTLDLACVWAFGDFNAFVVEACINQNVQALEWAYKTNKDIPNIVAVSAVMNDVKSMYLWASTHGGSYTAGSMYLDRVDFFDGFKLVMKWLNNE